MPKLAKDRPRDIHISAPKEAFAPVYYPYINCIERYEVYFGGASAGKSVHVANKLVLQLSTREGRNLMLLRHTLESCLSSCWNQIKQAIIKFHLESIWQINESNHTMTCVADGYIANGNMIICRGMNDVETIKSVTFPNGNLTDIWYEEASEEMDRRNINVLDERLRGGGPPKRLILTFNPIFRDHWLREWIDDTLRNRRCIVLKTTYKDNPFLSKDDILTLEQTKNTDPYHYMVYCLGEWGIQGQTIFNANEVNKRKQVLEEKYKVSAPVNVRFQYETEVNGRIANNSIKVVESKHNTNTKDYCFMYKPCDPNRPYVMIHDTAGEGSDYNAIAVFDNTTEEQVMVYHSSADVDDVQYQVYCMGRYYNNAMYAPEVNFNMYPIKKMQELGYTNFYTRNASVDSIGGGYTSNIGYRTHSGNREMMISTLVEWINKGGATRINDIGTLEELLTFVLKFKKKNGQNIPSRAEAANGAHDDLVIALGIYLMVKDQASDEAIVAKPTLKGFYLDTELEDMVQSRSITRRDMRRYQRDNVRDGGSQDVDF